MQTYLTPAGRTIYETIMAHIDLQNWSNDIDSYELSMLANSFDTYAICAEVIKEKGLTQPTKTGFLAVRPEVGIMQKCYSDILKHSAKFGLNPGDRKKIFKMAETKRNQKKRFLLSKEDEREAFISWWNDLEEAKGEPDMSQVDRYLTYRFKHHKEPESLFDIL